jgi:hypothetical protein
MSQRSIDEIVDLYHAWGDENYDEDVSQILMPDSVRHSRFAMVPMRNSASQRYSMTSDISLNSQSSTNRIDPPTFTMNRPARRFSPRCSHRQ